MSKQPGTAGTMPVTGSGCGVRPSAKAMEVEFGVDFSKAKDLLDQTQREKTKNEENQSDKTQSP